MLDALLRHDRTLVLAGLVAVIVLSWVWLMTGAGLKMDEMDMGGGRIMLMALNTHHMVAMSSVSSPCRIFASASRCRASARSSITACIVPLP